MTDELRGLEGAQLHRGDRLGLKGIEQQRGPFGTAHEGVEDGRAQESGGLRKGGREDGAVGEVAAGGKGLDDRTSDGVGSRP